MLKTIFMIGLFATVYQHLSAKGNEGDAFVATAGFTATTVCEGEETIFTNTSSTSAGSIVTYQWDFKDGNGSVLSDPRHVFAYSGTFNVTLTVQDDDGDFDVFSTNVIVHPKPDVGFNITSADQCESTAINFTNTSSIPAPGVIDNYAWDFGDGNSATTTDASNTYASPGTYTVSLTATSLDLCVTVYEEEVTIHPEAVVDFDFDHVCEENESVFTNNSQIASGSMSYEWTFDDGSSSTQINPTHLYATYGDYDVLLQVTSDKGCETQANQTVSVHPKVTPGFTVDDVCFGESMDFTNTSNVDVGTLTYVWDFGDGSATSTLQDPSHDYDSPGTYLVVLTVTSNNNCVATYSENVNVNPLPVVNFSFTETCDGTNVAFTNLSTISAGSMTYEWDFGDGGSSTDTNPTHLYALANTYLVRLTVTSGFNCESILEQSVVVDPTSVGGTVADVSALCEDDDTPGSLNLSGHTGDVIRWESSLKDATPWSSISNTTTSLDFEDLPESTYYRAVVKSGACGEVFSASVFVQIDELSEGGSLSGSADACFNNNNGTLELTGNNGSILEWQSSTVDATSGFGSIANTANSLDYTDLTATTYYRAVVKNGACSQTYSSVATITSIPETETGLLSGATTVCKSDNSGSLSISGNVGEVQYWESSLNGLEPWSTINNETTTLEYEDLLTTTYYRAVVKSGVCDAEVGNLVQVEVDENTVAGEISGPTDLCIDQADGTLELTGAIGSVNKWQFGNDLDGWTDITNTTTSETFSDLTETTEYKVFVQNGVCLEKETPAYVVNIHPLPVVSFTNTEVCHEITTELTNTSTISSGSLEDAFWDFGDGSSSDDYDPDFTFPDDGSFQVELTMTSDIGCENSANQSVTVHPNPTADFSFEEVCFGSESEFTDVSTIASGSVDAYAWDFGDGASATDADPDYVYSDFGEYEVVLVVTSDQNCSDEISQLVTIYEMPVATFDAEDHCEEETLAFDNNSSISDGGIFYTWNFGDGYQSTDSNPSHTYASDGDYIVSLTVESTDGSCVAEDIQTITVHNKPVAGFNVENVCLGEDVEFEDTSDNGGGLLSYAWDFGDGNSSTVTDPNHNYSAIESYDVTLEISTDEGCTDTFTDNVIVNPVPSTNFSAENVCENIEVSFTNLTTISSSEINYSWDFGDGTNSTDINPRHLYDRKGVFTVSLSASTYHGCEQAYSTDIEVNPKPVADFEVEDVCDGYPSAFENLSSISPTRGLTYAWDFGDGSNSNMATPVKQYLNDGEYTVELNVTSEDGCTDQVTKQVTVYEFPMADFSVTNACFENEVTFDNQSSSGGSLTHTWEFGDGNSSVSISPRHNYSLPGNYDVKLIVSTINGCKDSVSQKATVYHLPEAFAGNDTTVSLGYAVQLQGSGGNFYEWTPHESLDNPNIYNPFASPAITTIYELTVSNEYGCIDTDEIQVEVLEDYKIVPTNVLTPDGNGMNDSWTIENVETFGSVNVVVFDRWGKLVYEKKGYQNDWQGTAGADILPDGTYYYIITFDESDQAYKGAITIIRNR
ncbi:MAG: PKD domain-containing protein [Reichenbachiella sp.]|uniref:PKD domain-containing protein n=1 Tax=Reichenbachiella sp. TaxID=2184521 RepID=UPI0032982381